MFWQVTVASTGPQPEVDQEGKATGRERVFLHSSTGQRELVDRYLGRLSRLAQCLDRFNILASKTYFFLFFSLLTLRQGL